VAAAVGGGARDQRLHAFQALPVGREHHHQLARQQGGANAGAVGAAGARIDQHETEMARRRSAKQRNKAGQL
jgi:hypothetical protein